MKTIMSVLAKGGLVALSFSVSLVSAEIGLRIIDGYSVRTLALDSISAPSNASNYSEQFVAELSVADGVSRAWYEDPPPPTNVTPSDIETIAKTDPDLARIFTNTQQPLSFEGVYEWNKNWILRRICANTYPAHLAGAIFTFDPGTDSIFPRYRLPREIRFPLEGGTINSFGFRGTPMELNKPSNTIRIAFLGASTTLDFLGARNAYPDFVGHWLNLWAKARGLDVRFEVINGGRFGFGTQDIAAMFHSEIVPLEPDIVFYYEGVNDFSPGELVAWPNGRRPSPPNITQRQRSILENYSDLVGRSFLLWDQLRWSSGDEPTKPEITVREPLIMQEASPDPFSPELPEYLRKIVSSLEDIRQDTSALDATLTVVPFLFMVHDGLTLDINRNFYLFKYLNDTFYPFRYSFLRRQIDFENLIFRQYDRKFGLPIIDLDLLYPQDPELFVDAVHMYLDASRLKAWIIFNGLVGVIQPKIAEGKLPRAMRHPLTTHPAFPDGTKRTISKVERLRDECKK
jgi:hypothetical protein